MGQGAGVPPAEHREPPDTSCSGAEVVWWGRTSDGVTHRATWADCAVDRRRLETDANIIRSQKHLHHYYTFIIWTAASCWTLAQLLLIFFQFVKFSNLLFHCSQFHFFLSLSLSFVSLFRDTFLSVLTWTFFHHFVWLMLLRHIGCVSWRNRWSSALSDVAVKIVGEAAGDDDDQRLEG